MTIYNHIEDGQNLSGVAAFDSNKYDQLKKQEGNYTSQVNQRPSTLIDKIMKNLAKKGKGIKLKNLGIFDEKAPKQIRMSHTFDNATKSYTKGRSFDCCALITTRLKFKFDSKF